MFCVCPSPIRQCIPGRCDSTRRHSRGGYVIPWHGWAQARLAQPFRMEPNAPVATRYEGKRPGAKLLKMLQGKTSIGHARTHTAGGSGTPTGCGEHKGRPTISGCQPGSSGQS